MGKLKVKAEYDVPTSYSDLHLQRVSHRLHVHNDIEEAAKYYNIPLAMWSKSDVFIMQEDRCVFVGSTEAARIFYEQNDGKYCKSRFPL